MRLPVLLAVDDDRGALDDVEAQLVQRYAQDYRIESLGIRTTRCGRCRSSRTEARTWRSCSPHRRSRLRRVVTSSSTRASFTRTQGGRCSFRRTSGWISQPPTRSATRWRLDASTTTCLGRRAPSTRSSTRPSRFSARVGEGSAHRSADGAHRGRDLVGPGLRAEGGLRAMRCAARLLPCGVGARGASCSPGQAPTRGSR